MSDTRSRFEPGLPARDGPESGTAPESDPLLVERIRAEIERRGPITFQRFMERALYEPDLGYYRRTHATAGRSGDFLTAPEAHPIFGAALARQLDELWRIMDCPSAFTVREYGAGRGALAEAVFAGLRAEASPLFETIRYQPAELNPHRMAELQARLGDMGIADRVEPAVGQFVGVTLANEFLDALPVHLVEQRGGALCEVFVEWDEARGTFVEVLSAPSTPALAERLESEQIRLEDGQRGEICLAIDPWLDEVGREMAAGFLVVIDYGFKAPELYGPRHRAGTLLGYATHRVLDDPLVAVGRQDLTAHVDLTALGTAARARGFVHVGTTTQAEFLVGVGVGDIVHRIQADPATTFEQYTAMRSALARMLDPRATGAFRVIVFGHDVPREPTLSGLGFSIAR